jgi:hypothetical protein
MFLSGLYLLICSVLGFGGAISDANAIGFFSALFLLTVSWSLWFGNVLYHNSGVDSLYFMLAAGTVLNAFLLYGIGLLITNLVRFLRGSREAPQD